MHREAMGGGGGGGHRSTGAWSYYYCLCVLSMCLDTDNTRRNNFKLLGGGGQF